MFSNNTKQKRKNIQKSSNTNDKVFDKSKSKKNFDKVKPTNSKIVFDDDGNQQKSTKKKNTKRQRFAEFSSHSDEVTSRWYEEVNVCETITSTQSF